MSKLRIGTAQFGMNYGITNKRGKLSEDEVRDVICEGLRLGISKYDTASAYGDSEEKIGMSGYANKLDITTKVTVNAEMVDGEVLSSMDNSVLRSIESLRVESITCLLVHGTDKLGRISRELLSDWMQEKKSEGLVEKCGVSIYDSSDLTYLAGESLDVVQLPLSVYDQRRVVDKTIKRLQDEGKEIQARSIFMQGLILQHKEDWPGWTDRSDRDHHGRFCESIHEMSLTLQEAAIGVVINSNVDEVVAGITSMSELRSLNEAFRKMSAYECKGLEDWALTNERLIDPRKWPD